MHNPHCAYFVAGTDTGVGKTLIAATLLHVLTHSGIRSAGMKPIAAGAIPFHDQWQSEDANALIAQASVQLPPELITPYLLQQPTAPHIAAAAEGKTISLSHIINCYRQIETLADVIIVEGTGGFQVPLNQYEDTADLAQALGLPVILVVGMRLGCINHALLSAQAITARGLSLAGWIANDIDPHLLNRQQTIDTLAARIHAPLIGHVPSQIVDSLSYHATVAATARHLQVSLLPGWPCAPATSLIAHSPYSKEPGHV